MDYGQQELIGLDVLDYKKGDKIIMPLLDGTIDRLLDKEAGKVEKYLKGVKKLDFEPSKEEKKIAEVLTWK